MMDVKRRHHYSMSALNEQERNTFSDPEYIRRRRRYTKHSKSLSSPVQSNDEASETNSNERISSGLQESKQADEMGDGSSGSCPLDQQHQGKRLLHVVVALPVDLVFKLIFVQEQVMSNVFQARKCSEVVNGPWQEEKDTGHLSRQVTYNMSINVANFGSKTANVTEKQTLQHSQQGQCHVVATEAANTGIPYADSFTILCHYCFLKEPDGRTNVTVWAQVKYKKQVWGVVKGMLERNAYNGLEALLSELLSQITLVAERSERKGGDSVPITSKPKTHTRSSSYGYKRQIRSPGKEAKDLPSEPSSKCNLFIGIAMTLAFAMLILSNYILYNKLYDLEVRSQQRNSKPQLAKFLEGGGSLKDQKLFLQRHQRLQSDQLQSWKAIVIEATERLEEVHESLQMVMDKIKYTEDAMDTMAHRFYGKSSESIERDTHDTKVYGENASNPEETS